MDSITIPKVSFFLREGKSKKKKHGALFMRIYYKGINAEISLKKEIPLSKWNKKAGEPAGNAQLAKELKLFFEIIDSKVQKHFRYLLDHNQPISSAILKNLLLGRKRRERTLLEAFKYHNLQIKELENTEYAPGTILRYQTTMEHIKRFLKQEYNLADIPLSELNYQFVTTLDKYFRLDRKCNHNTTAKYIKNLKKIINLAIKLDWLEKDPFIHYQVKTKPVERGFLTQQELDRIINYRFSTQRLELVADLFVFSCYTGLAYIDIKKLPQDAIVTGIDACQWLSIQRQKTGTTSNIPLLPPALRIIEKYKDHPLSSSSGKLLPVLSNQKLNSYLKEIADLCRINKNLTFHLARHTFATSVTLANGISMEAVSKMLGHQSVRTTQIYSKIVESQISNEMQKLRVHFTPKKEDLKKSNQ